MAAGMCPRLLSGLGQRYQCGYEYEYGLAMVWLRFASENRLLGTLPSKRRLFRDSCLDSEGP